MKKLILLVCLVLMMFLFLSACNSETTPFLQNSSTTLIKKNGYEYLIDNLNKNLGLIRESPDTGSPQDKTYWLLNDNLLASYALQPNNPELSNKLMSSLEKYGYQHDNYIEILCGNRIVEPKYALDPSPRIIEKNEDYIIQTEKLTNTIMDDFDQYLDKLCYETLWYAYGETRQEAFNLFNKALNTWDGEGFNDIVFKKNHNKNYATYKLAIFYYTAKVLGVLDTVPFNDKLLSIVYGLQDSNGGFHTSYDFGDSGRLRIRGSTNTETTSLILIALNNVPEPLPDSSRKSDLAIR
jgi:hypothetical protein